ncbi:MAG: E3 binding domain-containing protein, partial [Desulfobacterales bacterium]
MSRAFKLPDLGEGVHEGEVLALHVVVGQKVKEGDIILEVETDKAAVEIPSPATGTVAEIMVKPGDTVKVGDVMMTFSVGSEAETAKAPALDTSQIQSAAIAETAPPAETGDRKGPVPASPATRRLARELSVDLQQVTPTGPGGVVTADDVRTFTERGPDVAVPPQIAEAIPEAGAAEGTIPTPSLPDFSRWGPVERVPFRSIRRATAKQMVI